MNTTIRATIPTEVKQEIDRAVLSGQYSSVNEAVKTALSAAFPQKKRRRLTVNGFTPEIEREALQASKEPRENDIILRTPEDIDKSFDDLMKKISVTQLLPFCTRRRGVARPTPAKPS